MNVLDCFFARVWSALIWFFVYMHIHRVIVMCHTEIQQMV